MIWIAIELLTVATIVAGVAAWYWRAEAQHWKRTLDAQSGDYRDAKWRRWLLVYLLDEIGTESEAYQRAIKSAERFRP